MAKQTKITIETDSLFILKGCRSQHAWCPRCAGMGEVIRLEETAVLSNLTALEVKEWLASEELHRYEAADGSTLICLNSLLRWMQSKRRA